MAAEAPFSLADLDPEARALAKEAARAAGVTPEEWVIRAILRKTGGTASAPTPPAREYTSWRPTEDDTARTTVDKATLPAAAPTPPAAETSEEPPPSTPFGVMDLLAALNTLAAEPAPSPFSKVPAAAERPPGMQPPLPAKELEKLKRALERIGSATPPAAVEVTHPLSSESADSASPSPQPQPPSPERLKAVDFDFTARAETMPAEDATAARALPSTGAKSALKDEWRTIMDIEPIELGAEPLKPEPKESLQEAPSSSTQAGTASGMPSPASAEASGIPPSAPAVGLAPDPLKLDKPLLDDKPVDNPADLSFLRPERDMPFEEEEGRLWRLRPMHILVLVVGFLALFDLVAWLYLSLNQSKGDTAESNGWMGRTTSAIQSLWQGAKKEPLGGSTTNGNAKPPSEAAPAQEALPAAPAANTHPEQSPGVSQQPAAPRPAPAAPAVTAPDTTSLSPSSPPSPSSVPAAPTPQTAPAAEAPSKAAPAPAPAPPQPTPDPQPTPAPASRNAAPSDPQTAALPSPAKPSTKPTKAFAVGPATVQQLEALAKKGDEGAQHDLATLYARGDRMPQDYVKAAHWFRESALQGVASSQYNLGVLYEQGLGVKKDSLKALIWYLSAAEQGYPAAQYNAGVAYAEGKGIPQNYVEARRWFEKAATLGLAKASYNLGVLNELGLGGSVDLADAYKWYKLALRGGESEGQTRLEDLAKKITPIQIADGNKRYDAAIAMIPTNPAPLSTQDAASLATR